MPIYEYSCQDCSTTFEVLTTAASRDEKVQCSKCHSDKVIKVMSAGSFRLGSGLSSVAPPSGCQGKSGFS